jgi:integrase
MPTVQLTDRFCANSKAGKERVDYFDAKTRGLALRVAPSGVKAFTLHFTAPDGRRARLTLGRYPSLSLARARSFAIESLSQVHEGVDPRDRGADTVSALASLYMDRHVRPNLRSAAALERRVRKNVLPIIGNRPLTDLHRREIRRVIDPVLERGKPVEAARVFEDTRAMFRWGVREGLMDANPMDGMRRPATSPPRERTLSDGELRQLWERLPEALPRSNACQRIIKLCLLTGQRVGEVAGMMREELDLEARTWTIPSSRSKNKHAHTVPLCDAALALIDEAEGVTHVFPGKRHGALSSHSVAKMIRLAQDRFGLEQWTAHDLRRTAVTNMAKLGVTPIVLGHVINHRSVTKAGVTLAVYSHYAYEAEKRQALELWADELTAVISGKAAKVVPLSA